jgi:hypothetical protein
MITYRARRRRLPTRWSLIGLVLALALSSFWGAPAATAQVANLLSNPGCEGSTGGFSGYNANIAAVSTVKRSGNTACRVAATAGPFYTLTSTQSVANPAAGSVYSASAWVRADSNNGRPVFTALRERGGATSDHTMYGNRVLLSTQWQQVSITRTVQAAGRTGLDFYLVQDPGSSGQVFYADDLQFSPASLSPSGQAMPVGNLPGWRQVFAEDFTANAPTGSWAASCATDPNAANKIVYTGATGTQWRTYPDCYLDTYQKRPYRSDQVLSVHDGVLDFHLRNVDGQPAGANPSPVINAATGSQYQTYGRYSARFRVDTTALSEYHIAWLLWPENDADWECAESDFPESSLSSATVSAFHHYGCNGAQDSYSAAIDYTKWHTFTQEWAPGVRRYYLDGQLIGTSTNAVFAGPQRWQLQTETKGSGSNSGHLLVDWVAVYAYQP